MTSSQVHPGGYSTILPSRRGGKTVAERREGIKRGAVRAVRWLERPRSWPLAASASARPRGAAPAPAHDPAVLPPRRATTPAPRVAGRPARPGGAYGPWCRPARRAPRARPPAVIGFRAPGPARLPPPDRIDGRPA